MPFAAAISTHPVTAQATGEVVGEVLERLGRYPDLVVLFVTAAHAGALEDAAKTVRQILEPSLLLGCAAESVVGGALEIEQEPAVTLWAGVTGPVAPLKMWAEQTSIGGVGEDPDGESLRIVGWPESLPFEPQAVLLLGDPFTFPVEGFLKGLEDTHPGLPVLGGMASAAHGPGGNRLVLNDQLLSTGAIGALIGPGTEISTVVSQGCRPIGRPLVVTRAERNVIYELAGEPALERLLEMARTGMPERDIRLINQGLHVGLVIDEHKAEFGRGDFLIRNVIGADRSNGAIAVGDEVEVGTTMQFHVRDAEAADEDLRHLLVDREADGALLFTCNGRGSRLFHEPNHDAGVVEDLLHDPPLAGFFAAGEVGPVGGRNFLHGFTASLALFRELNPGSKEDL
jgi:small ligand-binding sensory domain FIST